MSTLLLLASTAGADPVARPSAAKQQAPRGGEDCDRAGKLFNGDPALAAYSSEASVDCRAKRVEIKITPKGEQERARAVFLTQALTVGLCASSPTRQLMQSGWGFALSFQGKGL